MAGTFSRAIAGPDGGDASAAAHQQQRLIVGLGPEPPHRVQQCGMRCHQGSIRHRPKRVSEAVESKLLSLLIEHLGQSIGDRGQHVSMPERHRSRGEFEARNYAERRTGGFDPLEAPRRALMMEERRMTGETTLGNPRLIEMNGRKRYEHAGPPEFDHKIVEIANQRDERRAISQPHADRALHHAHRNRSWTPWPTTSAT